MKTGSDQRPGGPGAASREEDETLEIVRLMMEAETGASKAPPETASDQGGAARPEPSQTPQAPAGGSAAPTPGQVNGHRIPTRRAKQVPRCERSKDQFDTLEPQAALREEDPGPGKALRLSRLRFPPLRRRAPHSEDHPDEGRQAMPRKRAVLYAKLAALAGAALLLVWKPWLVPLLIFLTIWLALVLFLLLGSTRISELTAKAWAFYCARRPKRAARIYKALQRGADRADGLLARLPEKWTEGIYTPDLGRSELGLSAARRAALEDDPFSRLAREETRSGRDGPGRGGPGGDGPGRRADAPGSQTAAAK